MDCKPEILGKQTVVNGQWLDFHRLAFRDVVGQERVWEYVERTTKPYSSDVDCVAIIAILKRPLKFDCLLLVKQYRPALQAFTIEFPAGLVEQGETIECAALRELREETGYSGLVKEICETTALDPGVSNCTMKMVTVEVRGTASSNKHIKPLIHEGAIFEVVPLPISELQDRLNEYAQDGIIVDSRVQMYAMGLRTRKLSYTSPEF